MIADKRVAASKGDFQSQVPCIHKGLVHSEESEKPSSKEKRNFTLATSTVTRWLSGTLQMYHT